MTNRTEEIRIMSLPKMQEKFREAMGEWLTGDQGQTFYRDKLVDFVVIANYGEGLLTGILHTITDDYGKVNFQSDDLALLRLPLPIDPVNPERGVLGMLRGVVPVMSSDGYTPTLALLKALAHQWNVEVEG